MRGHRIGVRSLRACQLGRWKSTAQYAGVAGLTSKRSQDPALVFSGKMSKAFCIAFMRKRNKEVEGIFASEPNRRAVIACMSVGEIEEHWRMREGRA